MDRRLAHGDLIFYNVLCKIDEPGALRCQQQLLCAQALRRFGKKVADDLEASRALIQKSGGLGSALLLQVAMA